MEELKTGLENLNIKPAQSTTSNTDKPREYQKKRVFKKKRKVCRFCDEQMMPDYKNIRAIKYYINERGKILPARISGVCAKHQRRLTQAIKRARLLALLPFSSIHSIKRY